MKQETYVQKKKKKDNGLMSNKHIKFCKALNYIELFLIFISAASVCVSISVFVLLVGIPISITSSAVGLQICAIPAVTKKYQSVITKKKEKSPVI